MSLWKTVPSYRLTPPPSVPNQRCPRPSSRIDVTSSWDRIRIREALALDEGVIDPVFRAAADATEEAILNSLFKAERMVGRNGNTRDALPLDRVMELLKTR